MTTSHRHKLGLGAHKLGLGASHASQQDQREGIQTRPSGRLIRRLVPPEIRAEGLADAAEFLCAVTGDDRREVVCDAPIFLLSAGWRSGSTLLQRLICSDSSILIWGEPFGDTVPVPRLAQTVANMNAGDPHVRYAIDRFEGNLENEWIANLNPGLPTLRNAHLSYFERLLAMPAMDQGATRWGAKWVRLTAEHGLYLKWLYPRAKFVLLVRHPLDAYHSYKGKSWFSIKPERPMDSVWKFMAHWGYLATTFLQRQAALDALIVRYEDLIADPWVIEQLREYLQVEIKGGILKRNVGAQKDKRAIRPWDKLACSRLARKASCTLGYKLSGETVPWDAPRTGGGD